MDKWERLEFATEDLALFARRARRARAWRGMAASDARWLPLLRDEAQHVAWLIDQLTELAAVEPGQVNR